MLSGSSDCRIECRSGEAASYGLKKDVAQVRLDCATPEEHTQNASGKSRVAPHVLWFIETGYGRVKGAICSKLHSFRIFIEWTKGTEPGAVRIDQFIFAGTMHDRVMKAAVIKAAVMRIGDGQVLLVRCPTCGARAREKCELNTGLPRTDPHPARRLAAEKK
jgi:hypothetical protein